MSRLVPKRTFSLEEMKPHEKLYEVSVILKDVPGALAKAIMVLTDANVNLKTGSAFSIPGRNRVGCWSSFIDISKANRSIQELEEQMRSLDVVEHVRFEQPKPAPFEIMHFPIIHGNTRAVIMPIGTVRSLWEGLEKILLPSGLAAVHYDAGKNTGAHTAEYLKEKYGLEKTDLIQAFAEAMKATGWGIIETQGIDFNTPLGNITVKECFEALAWREKSYKACHWTRGLLAGFMSIVFGRRVEAIEVECLATGDKHCKFRIQPKI